MAPGAAAYFPWWMFQLSFDFWWLDIELGLRAGGAQFQLSFDFWANTEIC